MNHTKRKKFKSGGCYITDENFNPVMLTMKKAMTFANNKLKRNRKYGCTKVSLIEKDDYFCCSIY